VEVFLSVASDKDTRSRRHGNVVCGTGGIEVSERAV